MAATIPPIAPPEIPPLLLLDVSFCNAEVAEAAALPMLEDGAATTIKGGTEVLEAAVDVGMMDDEVGFSDAALLLTCFVLVLFFVEEVEVGFLDVEDVVAVDFLVVVDALANLS